MEYTILNYLYFRKYEYIHGYMKFCILIKEYEHIHVFGSRQVEVLL
jgi:hypothetical protein